MTNLEPVARAICTACDENPDHQGDARGNQYRWQDYIDVAQAAIAAVEPIQPEEVTERISSKDAFLLKDLCLFSFGAGVRWAEKQHGIGCETPNGWVGAYDKVALEALFQKVETHERTD